MTLGGAGETIACPGCACSERSATLEEHAKWIRTECPSCALSYWHPLEFEESQYSEDERYIHHALKQKCFAYHYRVASLIGRLRSNSAHTGRLLEIGCGNGSFLTLIRRRLPSLEVSGIDLNPGAVALAQSYLSHGAVICGNLFDRSTPLDPGSYDVVCFFEVLEHQTDLQRFMRRVWELVRPGGFVVGTVPNTARYTPLGVRRSSEYPPHHFLWWSRESLVRFLKSSGLQEADTIPIDFWSPVETSLHLDSILLGGVKRAAKRKLTSSSKLEEAGHVTFSPWYRALSSAAVRIARILLFAIPGFPFYLKSLLLSEDRRARRLLFYGRVPVSK